MENMQAKKLDNSIASRARLAELGRQGGMSEEQIRLSLRAGRKEPPLFVAADLERVAAMFLAELGKRQPRQVSLSEVRTTSKFPEFAWPRMCLAMLLCELTPAPLIVIARFLNRRDHTTIIHARDLGGHNAMRRDEALAGAVTAVRASFAERCRSA
jgi:hypothetical protein